MNDSTTAGRARPASVFAPGGCTWVPVPVGLDGPALHAWMALMRCRRGVTVTAPDRVLACLARRSPRTIQEGLRQLEADGMIERSRRNGRRVVTILLRVAGPDDGNHAGKYAQRGGCTDSQRCAKPYRSPGSAPIRNPQPGPSYGKEIPKKQAVPPAAASTPAGPADMPEPPCPAFTRFFARVCPAPG